MAVLEESLQRALSVRLHYQIGLSSIPAVEEWMDIHFDRFLEHLPMPPEMPNGEVVTHVAAFGSDLSRVIWGAWGDPRAFVPKLASYFRLCNMAKSDEAILDQIGNALEPKQVGHWIGTWGGKMVTGWHIAEARPWSDYEPMLGTHEAKYKLKAWVDAAGQPEVVRFSQAIGEEAFTEFALRVPGNAAQAWNLLDQGVMAGTGAPLPDALRSVGDARPLELCVRIRAGQIVKTGARFSAHVLGDAERACRAVGLPFDERMPRAVGPLAGDAITGFEYVRAGQHAGLDVLVDVNDQHAPAARAKAGAMA